MIPSDKGCFLSALIKIQLISSPTFVLLTNADQTKFSVLSYNVYRNVSYSESADGVKLGEPIKINYEVGSPSRPGDTFVLACNENVIQVFKHPNSPPIFLMSRLRLVSPTKNLLIKLFDNFLQLQNIDMNKTQKTLLQTSLEEKSEQRFLTVKNLMEKDNKINTDFVDILF